MRVVRSACTGIVVASVCVATLCPGAPGAVPASAVLVEGLTATVSASGQLLVAGRVADIGPRSAEWATVTVTAIFERFSGGETQKQIRLPQPVAPGAAVPFVIETQVGTDVVVRYTAVVSGRSGPTPLPESRATGTIPPSAYAEFGKDRIRVDVQLGAPSAVVRGPFVQAFFSIGDTRPIPPAWVRDVRVLVPVNGGSQEIHLAPGQTVAVLVPAYAPTGVLLGPLQVTEVVLSQ
jgi:hypothetical protein